MTCEVVRQELAQSEASSQIDMSASMREHVDACQDCWAKVIALRWTLCRGTPALEELQAFLGDRFEWGIDASWRLAREWNTQPRKTRAEVEEFYRSTPWYVYSLVLWDASGQRRRYVVDAQQILAAVNARSILDLGAGVGTDAIRFAENGLKTYACEYDNEASRFMRWRAQRRGIELTHIVPDDPCLAALEVDVLWAMDVIEHLPQPAAVLRPLLDNVRCLIYDTEYSGTSGGRQPFHYHHHFEQLVEVAGMCGLTYQPLWWENQRFRVFMRT